MRVYLISDLCSEDTYKKIIPLKYRMGQQSQKYLRLFAKGLSENGVDVETITIPPVNSQNNKNKRLNLSTETSAKIKYTYIKITNIPVIRNVMSLVRLIKTLIATNYQDSVIVIDMMSVTSLTATLIAKKIKGFKVLGILTDMPMIYVGNENHRITIQQRLNQKLCMEVPDAFLFLSEPMNKVVNTKKKPYVVIEGFSDINMLERENLLEAKHKPSVCFYAGGLCKEYGLDILVEGFIKADLPNYELHLCGDGSYVGELTEICKNNKNVKYLGVLDNETIVSMEEAATLLINPRYSTSEFVKYSFPSKNMEYLASGTPMVGTLLPSLPEEYLGYIFVLTDETAEGVSNLLKDISKMEDIELHRRGIAAKQWVVRSKNNIEGTKKVVKLVENLLEGKQK